MIQKAFIGPSGRGDAIRTADLHYDLPPDLIAQRPLECRDAARLLVLHRDSGRIEHRSFADVDAYLRPADCLVLNRSRVVPARFVAWRTTGGRIPGLFLKEDSPGAWRVLLTGAGRLRGGEKLTIAGGPWVLTCVRHLERGECEVRIEPPDPAHRVLEAVGSMPLPPYIRREGDDAELARLDHEQYQTVYARESGSVAAPTAGLHFTTELLARIAAAGTRVADVVLHVGLGTFQPVEAEDLRDHTMHREWFELDAGNAGTIAATRSAGGRIVAVGTTSVRVLETIVKDGRPLAPRSGWTDILIYPPYEFHAVDALITNFHLPGSTLLALAMAFAGRERILTAYREAIRERYRFFSYGDAMLIL